MRIAVLGAGVIGVATAYKLCKAGHKVQLIEQCSQPGMVTSYANGGQLSFNYHHTIANLNVLKQMPKILLGLDPAFRVYPTMDTSFYAWGMKFLSACLPKNVEKSEAGMAFLGQLSKQELEKAVVETGIDFDYKNASGKLYLYSDTKDFGKASLAAQEVSHERVLSSQDLANKQLGLNEQIDFPGGVFVSEDTSGDAHKFCVNMTQYLVDKYQLTTHFKRSVKHIEHDSNSIKTVVTDKGNIEANAYVLALGSSAVDILKNMGIKLPIYPMKGYSVTLPAKPTCPDISITFLEKRCVFCKLGDRVRIAGFAEFSGHQPEIKKDKIEKLVSYGRTFLPEAADYDKVLNEWCGMRPTTPDSLPIIGRSKYDNLFLNVGHGMLGWTQAMGSAHILSQVVLGQGTEPEFNYCLPQRFSTLS